MNLVLGILTSIGVTSCWITDNSKAHTSLPAGEPANIIEITQDTALTQNYKDTQFKVREGAVLDAGNFILDGRTADDSKSFAPVTLYGSSKLKNGKIIFSRGGVNPRPVGLPNGWEQTLHDLPQADRLDYLATLRAMINTGCPEIDGTEFYQNRIHIYVSAMNPCLTVKNCTFDRGRMGIYHDFGSRNAEVFNNTFTNIGKDHYEKSGLFTVPSARETIALDGTQYNNYHDNTFSSGAKTVANFYVNCGEENGNGLAVPREEKCLDNSFTNNEILDHELAFWVSSRFTDRHTYPCRSDEQGDRVEGTVLTPNTYTNVGVEVKYQDT